MKIRAKFSVSSVTTHAYGAETPKLHAVYGDGKANAEWAKATPDGSLEMTIDNPNAQGILLPGEEYFIDIRPANVEEATTPGERAYTAYVIAVGGKAFNGDPLPTYTEMKEDSKRSHLIAAWEAAASAV